MNFRLLLTSIGLLLLSLSSQAQYQSFFGKETTSWNREWAGQMEGFIDSINVLAKDTVRIDSFLYYRATNKLTGNRILRHVYREDTTKGRLYHYDTISEVEYLIVDMSLNKGDTFRTIMATDTLIVDSVYYISGLKHIIIANSRGFSRGRLAEGVGVLLLGIPYPFQLGGGFDIAPLLCQFKDGQRVYSSFTNSYYPDCNSYRNDLKQVEQGSVAIYPNPAYNTIHVKSDVAGLYKLELTNPLGQLVYTSLLNLPNASNVDVAHLPSGVYIVRITDAHQNQIYQSSIIINR